MNEELIKYYIPRSFIKKEMRYNFIIGFLTGMACAVVTTLIVFSFFL